MPTPSWTYNRLIRNINSLDEVMDSMCKSAAGTECRNYKKLKSVRQSLSGLAVMVKKEQHGKSI